MENIFSKLKLNPKTNRYDYDGDLDRNELNTFFVSEDKDGFIINFGKITGDFICINLGLKSLKGAPQEVGGWFDCSYTELTSLEGAPIKVGGDFDCSNNQLTSLEEAPQTVEGDFECRYNPNLHSLEGIGEVKGEIIKDF